MRLYSFFLGLKDWNKQSIKMESDIPEDYDSLRQRFEDKGQGHIFTYYDSYTEDEKLEFLDQWRQIDLDEINRLYNDVCK